MTGSIHRTWDPDSGVPEIKVSNSDIQTFKECRRKWWLTYYRGLRSKTRTVTGPLALGTRVHAALEAMYTDGQDPVEAHSELLQADREMLIFEGRDITELENEGDLGRIMLEGYVEWIAENAIDADFEVIAAEQIVRALVMEGRVELIGKLDMRMRRVSDGVRLFRDFKPQPLDELVATPVGYRQMGELKAGDYVLGSDFTPTQVMGVYDRGVDDVYAVTFNDGTTVRATADHPWPLTDGRVVETSDLKRHHKIQVIAPKTDDDDIELPIDPYVLGSWIGDGARLVVTRGTKWTLKDDSERSIRPSYGTSDKAVMAKVLGLCGMSWEDVSVTQRAAHHRELFGIKLPPEAGRALEQLGILGAYSKERFIPAVMMQGSYTQRRALLAGLMDADGVMSTHSFSCSYTTTSHELAQGVADLVRSLGGWAKIWSSKKPNAYKTPDGGTVVTGTTSHGVVIRLPFNPFTGERAARYEAAQEKSVELRASKSGKGSGTKSTSYAKIVRSVTYEGRESVRCIKVDRADSLYVTAGCTLTHNTAGNFADFTKIAHMDEQMLFYHLLEMLQEDEEHRCDGGMFTMLRKVKRSSAARPPFYEQVEVRHNKTQIQNFWGRVYYTLVEMLELKERLDAGHSPVQVAYPTPSRNCSWKCPFFQVCPMFDDGSNAEQMIEDYFEVGNPHDRYGDFEDADKVIA